MLDNFQLAAVVKSGSQYRLRRIPLHQDLQDTLAESWQEQYEAFTEGIEEVDFNAGYTPEEHERFRLADFGLPGWLAEEDSRTTPQLDSISEHEDELDSVRAIVAFARLDGDELILFQNFTRTHVIHPGRYIFLAQGTYKSRRRPGLVLGDKLAAVYDAGEGKLLFHSFRTANTFLPLTTFYREASEHDIRDFLDGHERLEPADIDAIAAHGSVQWFRKRFAMLRDSGILEQYTAQEILEHSQGYEVDIELQDGKILFPSERHEAKRLLQYLNEELFKGPITETLYETNSKREAD